jgi:hypothetical protein
MHSSTLFKPQLKQLQYQHAANQPPTLQEMNLPTMYCLPSKLLDKLSVKQQLV